MHRPVSLFTKTGITLAVAITVFLVISIAAAVNYILIPVSKRAADDLAALMVLSAQSWVELPPSTRPFMQHELLQQYELKIEVADKPLPATKHPLPYLRFLADSLERRLGFPVTMRAGNEDAPWFCVDIPMGGRLVRLSFPRSRIGARPPMASLLIIAAAVIFIPLTSTILVRRITWPLKRLSKATSTIGRGEILSPLPESGPREIAELTQNFNRMAQELRDLSENRTTLLAGISHDLRTPLTRMRLIVEMLSNNNEDKELVDRLHKDVDEMEKLITLSLELARGMEHRETELLDLQELIDGIIVDYKEHQPSIEWKPVECCFSDVDTVALRRIVINLIDNALRYGGDSAIEVRCHCNNQYAIIQVLDRGPGIPRAERHAVFHPFHRLENSRNRQTGGSGLGLAIAHQLCKAHGWNIELLPRERGGTEARIEIPR